MARRALHLGLRTSLAEEPGRVAFSLGDFPAGPALAREGLAEAVFHRGLGEDEVGLFAQLIHEADPAMTFPFVTPVGEDVTVAWRALFRHVTWTQAPDELDADAGDLRARVEAALRTAAPQARVAPAPPQGRRALAAHLSLATGSLRGLFPSASSRAAPSPLATDDGDGPSPTWRDRALDAVLAAYVEAAAVREAQPLLARLRREALTALRLGDVRGTCSWIHRSLESLAHLPEASATPLSAGLAGAMAGGEALLAVLAALAADPEAWPAFLPILDMVPAREAPALLGALTSSTPAHVVPALRAFATSALPGRESIVAGVLPRLTETVPALAEELRALLPGTP